MKRSTYSHLMARAWLARMASTRSTCGDCMLLITAPVSLLTSARCIQYFSASVEIFFRTQLHSALWPPLDWRCQARPAARSRATRALRRDPGGGIYHPKYILYILQT